MADAPFSPLVGDILTQMITDTGNTTRAVIDDLTVRAEAAEELVAAIRERVERLFDGPWMPTPGVVIAALYPTPSQLAHRRKERGRG